MKKNNTLSLLGKTALIVALAGASGSLGFTLHAGRNNASLLLRVLFACWVISPFIALLLANLVANRWAQIVRVTLYRLILILTLGSLVCYSGVFSKPETKPAFVFLLVPLLSWLLILLAFVITTSLFKRQTKRNDNSSDLPLPESTK